MIYSQNNNNCKITQLLHQRLTRIRSIPWFLADNNCCSVQVYHAVRYSDVLKQFALTLYFYSQMAYNLSRKVLNFPNPSSLRHWRASVDLKEALHHLQKQAKNDVHMTDCSLMVDAMSIRKQTVWNNVKQQFEGLPTPHTPVLQIWVRKFFIFYHLILITIFV